MMIGEAVTNALQVTLELGPKGKKIVAVAPDWPGLARGSTTEPAAIERLCSYIPRYAPGEELAGMQAAFATIAGVDVVEQYVGTGSTDFWGISFAFSSIDQQAMPDDALERELTLIRACWAFFDAVRSRVSAEMQRGPRGGGRDRDHIVRHTLATEQNWAKKLGVRTPKDAILTDEGLNAHRDAYWTAIRALHAQGKMAPASVLSRACPPVVHCRIAVLLWRQRLSWFVVAPFCSAVSWVLGAGWSCRLLSRVSSLLAAPRT
jgi:hypothetical protein